MVSRFVFTIVFITSFQSLGFSTEKDSIVNSIFTSIYNQQFIRADSLLSEQKEQLDLFYYDILRIDLFWWKYSTTRSKTDAVNLTDLLEDYIETEINSEGKIKQLIGKSYLLRYQRKRYNLIGVYGLRSDINQLLSELKRNELPIAGNELKLFDLYMTLFQYFEYVNPFSIWSKTPERNRYLLKLEEFVKEENLIINTMAHYFLGRIYQKVERDPNNGKTHFKILSAKFPENKLFIEHLADCEQKL